MKTVHSVNRSLWLTYGQKNSREEKSMFWQNVVNACLAIIMTLLVYQNMLLQDQMSILENDIRIVKETLEIPKERVQFEVIESD